MLPGQSYILFTTYCVLCTVYYMLHNMYYDILHTTWCIHSIPHNMQYMWSMKCHTWHIICHKIVRCILDIIRYIIDYRLYIGHCIPRVTCTTIGHTLSDSNYADPTRLFFLCFYFSPQTQMRTQTWTQERTQIGPKAFFPYFSIMSSFKKIEKTCGPKTSSNTILGPDLDTVFGSLCYLFFSN